jgi:DNA-binding CsgD family transcriptional regulator
MSDGPLAIDEALLGVSGEGRLGGAFESLFAALDNGVVVTDVHGCHLYANEPMMTLLNSPVLEGSTAPPPYVPKDQHRQFWRTLSSVDEGSTSTVASIELSKGRFDRVLVLFTVVPWAVDGKPVAIWVAREAYEFEPNRKVLDSAANPVHLTESDEPSATPPTRGRAFESVVHTLTPREHEIILQLLVGRRVDSIAERLEISSSTVRNHLKSIFRKLEVHSQREAIDRFHEIRAAAAVDAPS